MHDLTSKIKRKNMIFPAANYSASEFKRPQKLFSSRNDD